MSPRIRKANSLSEFCNIDQKVLLNFFLLGGQALLIIRRKTLLLNCECDCSRMAVECGLAEEIFSVKIFFFALTPVFSVEFFYNIHSSWH